MAFWHDFKQFMTRGNVIDLAIAVVVGTAFSRVVNSFVNDILMPPIGILMDGIDFSRLEIVLKAGTHPVAIRYGIFINTIISFLIVAFSVFLVIKFAAKLHRKKESPAEIKTCFECCMLIPIAAKKCCYCGSDIPESSRKAAN